jgi:hyperosmotically inducible periplasmic protein
MRVLLGLVLLAAFAIGGWWYFAGNSRETVREAGENLSRSANQAQEAVRNKLHDLNFSTDDLREELARTGQVVREKAREIGARVADATSDARVTGAIKAKLVKEPSLSALSISVNTTDGVVTLSGRVQTHEDVKKAMDLALSTDGCNKVISTLQVKDAPGLPGSTVPTESSKDERQKP